MAYDSPGVYVNEVSSGSAPITGVGTSTAAFIGAVPSDVDADDLAPLYTPVLCTNFSDFKKRFGDFSDDESQSVLAHAVYGFFNNGGTRCYVIRAISHQDAAMNINKILEKLEVIDEISIIAAPGLTTVDLPIPSTVFDFNSETYIDLPLESLPAVESFTISFWACSHGRSTNSPFSAGIQASSGTQRVIDIYISPKSSTIYFQCISSDPEEQAGEYEQISEMVDSEILGVWLHWTFTKDSAGLMSIFRNGELVRQSSHTFNYNTLPPLSTLNEAGASFPDECTMYLGKVFSGGYLFKGMMSSVCIWSKALTAEEIRANMYTHLNGDEDGLHAYWPLNDDSGTTIADQTSSSYNGTVVGTENWIELSAIDPASAIVAHCQRMQDRFAILDAPRDLDADGNLDLTLLSPPGGTSDSSILPDYSNYAAYYFPWIEVFDPATGGNIYVPPSGHMAGIYARVDAQRGVHKAPANEVVFGALGLKYALTRNQQDGLNPQGVNCIRQMNGNIRVWGARTLGGDANGEFKYIGTRRLFNFLRESIDEGTQWAVFEPNDPALWAKITRNVSAFLKTVWSSGALFGNTPEEAFYVKCDEETNPPEVREQGQVVAEIGVAIIQPAEFVIFNLSQWTGAGQG